jgi:predicted peroxiredoxin
MADTERLVFIMTHGPEDPDRATIPLAMANAALAMEVEVVIVLQGTAVLLAKQGCLEHIFAANFPPLKELVDNFFAQGGKLLVCVPCLKSRKFEESDLIAGAQATAAGKLIQEILGANSTLVF